MAENVEIQYCSTVDGTGPLFVQAFWERGITDAPVVAVMPGFVGTGRPVVDVCKRLANKGLCAVAVDMVG